ncbi:MAG: sigma-54 dependent transcriptional regulator [Gemmataceae bacterium]|nr:sigma-54 dependent transcriptional regulator [Gemmataceae bacterium]
MARILLIDDEQDFCDLLREELAGHGYEVVRRESVEGPGAPAAGEVDHFDVLLLDHELPGKKGIQFLQELRQQGVQMPVIFITGHGTADMAIEAWRLGVVDFCTKPVDFCAKPDEQRDPLLDKLRRALARATETARLIKEPVRLPGDAGTEGPVLLGDPGREPMAEVYRRLGTAAKDAARDRPVLIVGSTGTGKDLVARHLFHRSARHHQPFLKVKCTAFQNDDLEIELFGSEGDDRRQIGAFEQAHGGAVLLDDAGETSRAVQAKILRVIDEGTVIRGGRGTRVPVDVWVIACALRDFDSELYYRLTPPIRLPPLCERGEDILRLAHHFLDQATQAGKQSQVRSFHEQALEKLRAYPWPGNARELQQTVRMAVLLCQGVQVTAADLKLGPGGSSEREVSSHLQRAIEAALKTGQRGLYSFLNELLTRELVRLAWTMKDRSLEGAADLAGLPPAELKGRLRDLLGIVAEEGMPAARPLTPSREKAWRLYEWARAQNPELTSDAAVFHWLQDRTEKGELPEKCDTFERYLREARAYYDKPRNEPRTDRPAGGSIVRRDQT